MPEPGEVTLLCGPAGDEFRFVSLDRRDVLLDYVKGFDDESQRHIASSSTSESGSRLQQQKVAQLHVPIDVELPAVRFPHIYSEQFHKHFGFDGTATQINFNSSCFHLNTSIEC